MARQQGQQVFLEGYDSDMVHPPYRGGYNQEPIQAVGDGWTYGMGFVLLGMVSTSLTKGMRTMLMFIGSREYTSPLFRSHQYTLHCSCRAIFISSWQHRARELAYVIRWTCDGYDYFAVPLTVPQLSAAFGVSTVQITTSITLTLLFRSLGAVIFGVLADRFGRKWTLVGNLILVSVLQWDDPSIIADHGLDLRL